MKETPLMQQYNKIKSKYSDALLLFRVGDFYETFNDDAIKTSNILGITLTKRSNGAASNILLAGFPYHSLNNYLPKLIKKGCRVAICEQLEDPNNTKNIIKRGVTELITPGVTFNDYILNNKTNNFILSIHIGKKNFGIGILDISTGDFFITEGNKKYILNLISIYNPSEILIKKKDKDILNQNNYTITFLEDWIYQYDFAYEKLCLHFNVLSLKGFGVNNLEDGIIAAGSILNYLTDRTNNQLISHISSIRKIENDNFIWIDSFTERNLELVNSYNKGSMTLFNLLDGTQTSMGARLLKQWISFPSKNYNIITNRWEIVDFFSKNNIIQNYILEELKKISDLERLLGKIATNKINPRELGMVRNSMRAIKNIEKIITSNEKLSKLLEKFKDHSEIIKELEEQLEEDLPLLLNKGNIIKNGVNNKLDELRNLLKNHQVYIKNLNINLAQLTNINNLKINFNSILGYYIEVTNSHKNKVPKSWIRKQTLVNSERYTTTELKKYEIQILQSENDIFYIEDFLYKKIINKILCNIITIQYNTKIISKLDVLLNFSIKSFQNKYIKPIISNKKIIKIIDGRHPIIEKILPIEENFISNSIEINKEFYQILIITGPNMSGKSAFLRQIALIIIMAQIGSFVPAKYLEFFIIDKIFTRVGAYDNISQGESTFMVEMNETSNIINNLKGGNSLVLLDEIGRGTSTYDGIAIAWSITEYLHEHNSRPLCLFATHYHELNDMANYYKRIKNFNFKIKKIKDKIFFLYQLLEGIGEKSFGIHVAKLAGIPKKIIEKAKEILLLLENKNKLLEKKSEYKINLFQFDYEILKDIKKEIIKENIDFLRKKEIVQKIKKIQKILGL